ncbi:phage replication protein [Enterobacter asburiae]|uniref:Phage replication protein n=1 Tax=Enterobacter asburiae TaxID=61645 RepID=A0A376FEQ6_ENTAS|nr:phage replication protein [Enterobacter asburiae]
MQDWTQIPQQNAAVQRARAARAEQLRARGEGVEILGANAGNLLHPMGDQNGSAPSGLWIAQIGSLTSDQTTSVCNAMVARCRAGNSWPPDLAEFVTLVADCGGSELGLKTADVMAEYRRWRNESYRYASTEEYFIARECHPVLYQICTELRRTGIERQLTEKELESAGSRTAGEVGKTCGGRTSDPAGQKTDWPHHAMRQGRPPRSYLKRRQRQPNQNVCEQEKIYGNRT